MVQKAVAKLDQKAAVFVVILMVCGLHTIHLNLSGVLQRPLQTRSQSEEDTSKKYTAGNLEAYFRQNHYNASGQEGSIFFQRGCPIWREETASPIAQVPRLADIYRRAARVYACC